MNFPRGAGQQFQPAKFEERGTAVAFTTPALSQARVRQDSREQLELTVSAFSGAKGNYVIRWKDVPDIFSLTMHDRALQDTIFSHNRSEEHTSELQSLMRISYAVFCLKKKKKNINNN